MLYCYFYLETKKNTKICYMTKTELDRVLSSKTNWLVSVFRLPNFRNDRTIDWFSSVKPNAQAY